MNSFFNLLKFIFHLGLLSYFYQSIFFSSDGSVSISQPNYANYPSTPSSSPSSSSSSSSRNVPFISPPTSQTVEIESIENIISDEEGDISVSSKSSSTSSLPTTSSTTFSTNSLNPRKIKSKPFSESIFQYSEKNKNLYHTKRITGMKILHCDGGKTTAMITCSMDKKLICIDIDSGVIKYNILLDGVPLCMSIDQIGSYMVIGLLDGRVQFFSTKNGAKIMEFTAHKKKVILIHQYLNILIIDI